MNFRFFTSTKSLIKNNLSIIVNIRKLDWAFQKYILNNQFIIKKIENFEMILDTKTPGISKTLATRRKREEDMTYLIKKELKPGMTAFDCGANIGYYALLEANCVGPSGKVITIEPDSRNYELLQKNLKLSPLRNIFSTENVALSNFSGVANLEITKYSNLNKINSKKTKSNSTKEVKCLSFKDLLNENVKSIDFVRMDIEGHEVEVFESIYDCLNDLKSGFTIFLEVHPNEYNENHSFKKILSKFLTNGFYCKYIVSAGSPQPQRFKDFGYTPNMIIKSDGFKRGVYNNIKSIEHLINLTCEMPKMSRYLMIAKH